MDNSKKIYALLFQRCSLELPTFQHRFNSNNDTVYFTDPSCTQRLAIKRMR